MSGIEDLYRQVIVDHAKERHGSGLVDDGSERPSSLPGPIGCRVGESHQANPLCGDEVRLRVLLEGDKIVNVSWEGHGCSISQASASVLHDLVEGATIDEADAIGTRCRALMDARGEAPDEETEEILGDAAAFTGVGRYPARIKCALLGWMALKDALVWARKEQA